MRSLWGIILGGCLMVLAGCEPDLNDNECDTDQDCTYKPGTVCSPENWCVLPVEAQPDPPAPDAMLTVDAAPNTPDMAGPLADMGLMTADQGQMPGDAIIPPVEEDGGVAQGDATLSADSSAEPAQPDAGVSVDAMMGPEQDAAISVGDAAPTPGGDAAGVMPMGDASP